MPPMTERERLIANLVQTRTDEQLEEIVLDLLTVIEKRKKERIEKAKLDFICAYRKFRELAPEEELWTTISTDDFECPIDGDLFEVMDENFL